MAPLTNLQTRAVETLIHPYTNQATFRDTGPLVIERGKGVYIYDTEGKAYLEGMAGLWCTALGYDNEELVEAAATQMRKLPFAHLFTGKSHDPANRAGREAEGDRAGPDLEGVLLQFRLGGERQPDEARLVHEQRARPAEQEEDHQPRQRAYHGVTIAAASLTGLPNNHIDFDLPIARVLHTSCPHHYRFAQDGESEEDFATRLAAELEELILKEGPDTVAAFIAEPVMGAGGVIVPPKTYFPKIMAVCAKYDVFMIDDEVICGFGRLGPDVRLHGARLQAAFDLGRQGAVVRLHADRGRDDPRGHVSGADRREQKDRHVRPRLHLFGPSGGGGGRGEDAGNLPARQDHRDGEHAHAAVPEAADGARRSSAGRRSARHGHGRRDRTAVGQARQEAARSEARRRRAGRALTPRPRG